MPWFPNSLRSEREVWPHRINLRSALLTVTRLLKHVTFSTPRLAEP